MSDGMQDRLDRLNSAHSERDFSMANNPSPVLGRSPRQRRGQRSAVFSFYSKPEFVEEISQKTKRRTASGPGESLCDSCFVCKLQLCCQYKCLLPNCSVSRRRAPISMGPCRLNSGALRAPTAGLYCPPAASGVPPWPPVWGVPALCPGSALAELPCQIFQETRKIWTRTRRTSCHSTEVRPFQIGGTVRTPELKGTGGAGPVGYALGSEIGD